MARRKGGLQTNVRNIFQDASIPEEIEVQSDTDDQVETDVIEETPQAIPQSPSTEPSVQQEQVNEPVVTDEVVVNDENPEPVVAESQVQPEADVTPDVESPAEAESPAFSDEQIERQMTKQKCEKDFSCFHTGLETLCKAKVIHRGKTVQCLEPKTQPCEYRIHTLFKRICQCPIRIYIAKKLGK